MKKSVFTALLLSVLSCGALAENIAVPILFQAKKVPENQFRVVGVGLYQDNQKFVWAVRISGLQELMKKDNFGAGFYFNSDNDKKTGRFAGKSGWDYQINLNIKRNTIGVIRWRPGNKAEHLPLYSDDYLIEAVGDILYVVLRKAAVKDLVFANRTGYRVTLSAVGTRTGGFDRYVYLNKNYGTFKPELRFFHFDKESKAGKRNVETVQIPRKDGVKVWNTFGERFAEGEDMPKAVGTAPALQASAARGESESFFFALTTDQPPQTLEAVPSDLVDAKGNKITAKNMFVRYIGFAGTLREEYYPDILSPVFMKSRSKNSFIALRVNTPRNIPAGVYKGEVRLKLNGKDIAPVPLEFEVYDFDMPEAPFFQTAYCIKPSYIKLHFKKIDASGVRSEFRAQQKLAREYRFSPRLVAVRRPIKWQGNEPVIDWREFDAVAKKYFHEYKFTCFQDSFFQMGSHNNLTARIKKETKFGTPDFEERFGLMVKKVHDHYRELGILDKAFFVFWDEPYRAVYPIIKQGIASAKKYVPDLQAGVFIDHVAPELEDHIDIWLSKFNTVAKLRLVRKLKNKKVWTYNNIGVSTFHAPASVPRMFYWLAHRYDINGYLYSEINVYNDNSEMERTDIPYNKRVNHAWFYPGAKPGMTMASLRMELSRDGLDDYDYLAMYRKFSGGKALPPAIKKMLPQMDRNGRISFKVGNNRQLQRFREMLAREIVKLKNKR